MTMKLNFSKYHGAGNDFVLIDARTPQIQQIVDNLTKEQIAAICHRRFGVGADGAMFLQSAPQGFDFTMRYFNSDGGESTMCGNGGRCIVRFADDLGVGGANKKFVAVDGEHSAEILDDGTIALEMIDVDRIHKVEEGWFLDTGSPHLVLLDEPYEQSDARRLRQIYNSNVNYVVEVDGVYHIRTFERGVEDETWACGTGTTAAAMVVALNDNEDKAFEIPFKAKGGDLRVRFNRNGGVYSSVVLIGGAQKVFEGVLQVW